MDIKIKVKDFFAFIVECLPSKMSAREAAEKIVKIVDDIPYTPRTVRDYIGNTKSGNPPSIVSTKQDLELTVDLYAMTEAGFNIEIPLEEDGEEVKIDESKNPISVVDVIIDNRLSWIIEGKDYVWESTGGTLSVGKDMLNDLFYYYSKHGMNWTRSKVCRKFNIEPKVFRSIIRAFELSKDSNIYAPHMSEELSPKELDDYINERMKRVFTSGERVEEKYTKSLNEAMGKVVDGNKLQQLEIDEFLGEIAENIKLLPVEINITKNKDADNGEIVLAITDLHIGAEVTNVNRTRDYSIDIIIKYLDSIASHVNSKGYSKVTLLIGGDILEGTPTNHPNSYKGISRGIYWGIQLIEGSRILSDFIGKIANLDSVHIVGSNHDRATGNNKEDTESTYATAIAYFLGEMFKDKINIHYNYDILGLDALGSRFILAHGDRGFHKRPITDVIFEHGDPNVYNVFLLGHWHSLQIPKDGDHAKYIKIHLPSLYTGNEFSASMGFSSLPGFAVFKRGTINRDIIDFEIIRL